MRIGIIEMGVVHSHVLCAIAGTIARPSAALKTIFHAPDCYRTSSVAIFAAVCILSAIPSANIWSEPDGSTSDSFDSVAQAYAKSLIGTVWHSFFAVAGIFWVGTRFGERHKFKNMFPVLSYCLIPIAVGAAATMVVMPIFDPLAFMHDDRTDTDAELLPTHGLDFAGGTIIHLAHGGFGLFFVAWAWVLFVKVTRMSQGFGIGKTVGVLALAITLTYAFAAAFGILQAVFFELVWL